MRRLLGICALLLLSAQASPLRRTFDEGETLDYSLRWLRVTGGSARMTIAPHSDPGRLRITSIAVTSRSFSRFYRARDEMESVVTADTFSTVSYRKDLQEGRHHKHEVTTIEEGSATRKRAGVVVDRKAVPTPVFDPLSLIYHIRLLELTPGSAHRFTVWSDGKVYTLRVDVLRRETIDTPAGRFPAVVVSPQMESGGLYRDEKARLTLWYSDDERHLPLRISSDLKFGSITATLRRVTPGVQSFEPVAGDSSK